MSRKKRNVPLPVIEDTPDEFIAWLEKQSRFRTFVARSRGACPLASYLNRRFHCRASVNSVEYSTRYGASVHNEPTPEWARAFVKEIDRHDPEGSFDAHGIYHDPENDDREVTVDEALETARWAKGLGA